MIKALRAAHGRLSDPRVRVRVDALTWSVPTITHDGEWVPTQRSPQNPPTLPPCHRVRSRASSRGGFPRDGRRCPVIFCGIAAIHTAVQQCTAGTAMLNWVSSKNPSCPRSVLGPPRGTREHPLDSKSLLAQAEPQRCRRLRTFRVDDLENDISRFFAACNLTVPYVVPNSSHNHLSQGCLSVRCSNGCR